MGYCGNRERKALPVHWCTLLISTLCLAEPHSEATNSPETRISGLIRLHGNGRYCPGLSVYRSLADGQFFGQDLGLDRDERLVVWRFNDVEEHRGGFADALGLTGERWR